MTMSIKKSVTIEAPAEVAFRVFCTLKSWWPLETHKIGKAKAVDAVVEPRAGGRWYEKGEDGSECNWGRVLAFEPGKRLLLTWEINPDWQADTSIVTEIEVLFVSESPNRTRVELEHRKLEQFGKRAEEMRGIFDSEGGWTGLLQKLASAAQSRVYFCKLVPPRPTFAMDMNDVETKAMLAHIAYWTALMEQGIALVFGPVADPAGPWGLGILRARDDAHATELQNNDPAIKANIGLRYESLPLLRAITRM